MNQILSMDPNNPSFGNNYNNMNNSNNGGNNGKFSNKTSKRIFAISIMVFGLILFIVGLVGVIKYFSTPKGPVVNYPLVYEMQNDNIVTINIKNDTVIDYIQYYWNENQISQFDGEGKTEITRDLTIPEGENVLNLNIVDINGKATPYSKTFVGQHIEDTTPPTLEVTVIGSKINIKAKTASETKLSYLTYRWNNEPEIRLEAVADKRSIETNVDVRNGNNTFTIVVVNENGIKEERVTEYKGIKKPVINITKDSENSRAEYLLLSVSHDSGIKSLEIVFNNKNVYLTLDHFGADKKVVEKKLYLESGINTLKVVATSMEGSVETYVGNASK